MFIYTHIVDPMAKAARLVRPPRDYRIQNKHSLIIFRREVMIKNATKGVKRKGMIGGVYM